MGKLHRIKKKFRKLASGSIKSGRHHVAGCSFYIGVRDDKSIWFLSGDSYCHLFKKLEREYRDGVGLSD